MHRLVHCGTANSNSSVSGSKFHLLLLWCNFWPGFSCAINTNNFIFIAMTNSQMSFVPLLISWKLFMTKQIQLRVQKKHLSLALNKLSSCHVSLNGMCTSVCVCCCAHKWVSTLCVCMWMDQMCQCAGEVDEKLPQKWGAMRSAQRSCRNKV